MTLTAQSILEQIRTLPPADRLRLVEQVVHDMASEVTTPRAAAPSGKDLTKVDLPFVRFAAGTTTMRWASVRSFECVSYRISGRGKQLARGVADNPGMSLPRAIVPGRRYMITRRCSERRFFMRPGRETNNAFIYCLALAARKTGVSIVCVGTLSNHWHGIVVDKHGRLPQFLEHFHKLFAKHQNALRGRWEAFWASEQTSVVELVKPEDVLGKMVYAIANPVTSHLVARVHHWPGVESLTAIDHNVPLTATKPIRFFDPENGDLPDVIDLHFRRAPGFERLSHVEYSKLLRDKVAEAEEKAAAERREKGIKLLGRRGVLNQHWNSRPGTREPRRGLSPRVACKNTWARVEALQRNQAFIDRYREARADHLAGREAIFPAGTWWLHRFAGVKCAELGATAPPS